MSNSRNSVSRGILIGQCNMAYNRIVKQGSHGSWKTWKQSWNFIVAFSRGGPESPGTSKATSPGKCWKYIKLKTKI